MKRYLRISSAKEDVGDEVFLHLCNLAPKRIPSSCNFDARLRDNSPECAAVLQILEQAGLRPRGKFEKIAPGQYECYPNYKYEPSDFDRADLFWMIPYADLKSYWRHTPGGVFRIARKALTGKRNLIAGSRFSSLVSESLRAELEAQNYSGLVFRPTVVVQGKSYKELEEVPWSKMRREPYWELSSSVVLPPLSPRCTLMNDRGERIKNDDWSRGVLLIEDEFPSGQLHYLRSDIEKMPPFDLAYTREPLGYYKLTIHDRRLVMSRRVYEFFRSKPYRIGWRPVYIDDE